MSSTGRFSLTTGGVRRATAASLLLVGGLAIDGSGVRGVTPANAVGVVVRAAETAACPLFRRTLRHDAEYMGAVLGGRATISVLVAAREGRGGAAGTAIAALGGRVDQQDPMVGYLRATLPTAAVPTFACQDLLDALEVDAAQMGVEDITQPLRPLWRDLAAPGTTSAASKASVGAAARSRAAHRPSLTVPLHEMAVDRFLEAHPAFDGRGVTIGLVEWVPDLLDVAVWANAQRRTTLLRPAFDWPTPPQRNVIPLTAVTSRDTFAVVQGSGYRVPSAVRDRNVLIGVVDERRFTYYYDADLNRDTNASGASPYIGILRDPVTHQVWVDTQQNRDWTDDTAFTCGQEPALTLGRDDPRTPRRESMAVLVLCDEDHPADVLFVPTAHRHATTVAATAGAAALAIGGHGIAPGVQLLPILQFEIGRTSQLIEAALRGFRDPRTDILTLGLVAPRRLHDGRSVAPLILDRAVRAYNKLLFSAVGNSGIGLETVSESATGEAVISVGAYAAAETLAATHGLGQVDDARPYWIGVHGPRADGMLKPDLIATAAAYLPSSRASWVLEPGAAVEEQPGYRVSWGTSLSAPAAAGAAALLLSGARQLGAAPTASALRAALIASARPMAGYTATEQGAGLITVPGAWDALQRGSQQRHIDVRAPVVSRLTLDGDVPPVGPALFEREGWTVGQRQTRRLGLTRRDGAATAEHYRVAVIGDARIFAVPSFVTLPLDRPIDLPVAIAPTGAGRHTALLRLTEIGGGPGWAQIPLTVVVAHELMNAEGGRPALSLRGRIPFAHFDRHFVRVPDGTASLSIVADATTGPVRPRLMNPAGRPAPYAFGIERGPWRYDVPQPEPGVWELILTHSDGAQLGLRTGEHRAPAAYAVTMQAVPPSSNALGSAAVPILRTVVGRLEDQPAFVLDEFYIGRGGGTIDIVSRVTAIGRCEAEHRVILERCDEANCAPALGSATTVAGTTLRVPTVGEGRWRAVIWRTTPATCPQEVTLAVGFADGTASGVTTAPGPGWITR